MKMGPYPKHKYSDIRIVKRFLWFPVHAVYQNELRWLERAALKQRYIGGPFWVKQWLTTEFVDGDGD